MASEKPTYGDELLDWADNIAARQSELLSRGDSIVRVRNAIYVGCDRARSELNSVAAAFIGIDDDLNARRSNIEGDAVLAAIQWKSTAQAHLNQLLRLRPRLGVARTQLDEIDAIGEPARFYGAGLHHVGREGVLESLSQRGYNSSATTTLEYYDSFHMSITLDGHGKVAFDNVSAESMAASLAYYYGGGAYAVVAVAVAALYWTVKTNKARERYETQNERVSQAITKFGRVSISPKRAYHIYTKICDACLADFAETRAHIRSLLSDMEGAWAHLFGAAVARLEAAENLLTAKKLMALSSELIRAQVEGLQLTPHFLQTAREVAAFNRDAKRLVRVARRAAGPVMEQLSAIEEAKDALVEGQVVFRNLLRKPAFLSIHGRLRGYIEKFEADDESLSGQLGTLFAGTVTREHAQKVSPERVPGSGPAVAVDISTQARARGLPRYAAIARDDTSVTVIGGHDNVDGGGFLSFSLSFGDDGLEVTRGPGNYGRALAGGGRGLRGVLAGLFDGGRRNDRRRATHDVGEMRSNLRERIRELEAEAGRLGPALERLFAKNAEGRLSEATRVKSLKTRSQDGLRRFLTANEGVLGDAATTIDSFVSTPWTTQDLDTTLTRLRATAFVEGSVPAANLRPYGPDFTIFNLRNTSYKSAHDGVRRAQFALRKAERDIAIVEARVDEHRMRGASDPVFKGPAALDSWRADLRGRAKLASAMLQPRSPAWLQYGNAAATTGWTLLDDINSMRFYGLGYTASPPEFRGLEPFEAGLTRKVETLLANGHHWNYACNIFVRRVLNEHFGVDDFVSPDPEILRGIGLTGHEKGLVANQMLAYMSKSPDYRMIGEATSQRNIDQAAHLASQGFAVIVAQKGEGEGHVAFVRAGFPSNRSPIWGKRWWKEKWGELRLPWLSSAKHHEAKRSFPRKILSEAFRSPKGVFFFVREHPTVKGAGSVTKPP